MLHERLIEFIHYKGLTKYKFYKETGLSNGFLDKKGSIGVDKCAIIYSKFPEINLEWLITGKGNMIKDVSTISKIDTSPNAPKFVEVNKTEHDKLLNLAESAILRSKELEGYVKTQQLTIDLLQDRLFRYESFETKNKWAAFKIPEPEKIEGK